MSRLRPLRPMNKSEYYRGFFAVDRTDADFVFCRCAIAPGKYCNERLKNDLDTSVSNHHRHIATAHPQYLAWEELVSTNKHPVEHTMLTVSCCSSGIIDTSCLYSFIPSFAEVCCCCCCTCARCYSSSSPHNIHQRQGCPRPLRRQQRLSCEHRRELGLSHFA